jgi:tetratricopeptide (TPR) repeat protein
MRDGHLGGLSVRDPFEDLVKFVTEGELRDGERWYRVAPTFGDLDPKELEAVMAELDVRIQEALAAYLAADEAGKQRAESEACDALELKAEALLAYRKVDEAIAEYQRLLDAFPNGRQATSVERRINSSSAPSTSTRRATASAGPRRSRRAAPTTWTSACGTDTVLSDRMRHLGLAALKAHAEELEKACKRTPRNHGAFAFVYRDLALEAAYHEDCDAYRHWFTQYVEAGGSVGDMMGYAKNHTPGASWATSPGRWCGCTASSTGAGASSSTGTSSPSLPTPASG